MLGDRLETGSLWGRRQIGPSVAAAVVPVVGIKKEVECEKYCLCMASKPNIEKGDWSDRHGQDKPDWQMKCEIQYQVDDQSEERSDSVVHRENRHEKITGLTLERVAATRTAIERHEPVP